MSKYTKGDEVYINWKGTNTKTYFVRESTIPELVYVEMPDCPKSQIIIPIDEVNNNDDDQR